MKTFRSGSGTALTALLLSGVMLAVAGCAQKNAATPAAQTAAAAEVHALSGVYEGMLPCADCAGIRTALYLRAVGTYTRVSHYEGADGAFDEGGSWRLEKDRIVFTPAAAKDETWAARPIPNGLRLLDREGGEVEGPLAPMYDLKRK